MLHSSVRIGRPPATNIDFLVPRCNECGISEYDKNGMFRNFLISQINNQLFYLGFFHLSEHFVKSRHPKSNGESGRGVRDNRVYLDSFCCRSIVLLGIRPPPSLSLFISTQFNNQNSVFSRSAFTIATLLKCLFPLIIVLSFFCRRNADLIFQFYVSGRHFYLSFQLLITS